MKLFIEGSAVFAERSGIGQFAKRLIEAYHQHYPDQQIRLFGFKLFYRRFTPPIVQDKTLKYRLIRWFPGKIYTGLFKKGINLPMDLMIGATKKDVIIFPNFIRWPLLYNKKSMAFIHDLSYELYGQYSSPPNRDYMLKFVPETLKGSDHILTISEASKKDIISHYNIDSSKISIVYPFIDTQMFYKRSPEEIKNIRIKFKLPSKYILFVSSLEPRKNVSGLMDAYDSMDDSIKNEFGLVLAGGKGWLNEDIHIKADELVKKGLNIIRTGYVSDEDLPALYSGASVFAFPTFYEGFGIPPLEAMACEVPVVTSNNSSLPEVVGDAAILIDANEPSQTADAISQILSNDKVKADLIQKGLDRIRRFNPQASAKQLNDAIAKLI